MPVESDADRAIFTDPGDFGVTAVYGLAAGGTGAVNGIFNNPHLTVPLNDVSVSDAQPSFVCAQSDLPAGAAGGDAGDLLTVDGAAYRVIDMQPDGTGMMSLTLGRA